MVDFQPKSPVGPVGPAGAGTPGPKGDPGTNGTNGTNATITGATATGLAAGATPTVTAGGTAAARTFAFGIPAGAQGIPGTNGTTPVVGTAAMLAAGTDTVQRSWSAKDISDFVTAKVAG